MFLVGAIGQALIVLGAAARISWVMSNFNTSVIGLKEEVHDLRATRDRHIEILARVASQLDALERRVGRVEDRIENR